MITPDPLTLTQYIEAHPIAAVGLYVLLTLAVIGVIGVLFRLAGIKLPSIIKSLKVPGFSIDLQDSTKKSLPEVGAEMVVRLIELAFDIGDYISKINRAEWQRIDELSATARDFTRIHVADTVVQFRELNHMEFNLAMKTGVTSPLRDEHFNSIAGGRLTLNLMKELMDIYDRNHFMDHPSEAAYNSTMTANYERIKRMVYMTVADGWTNEAYTAEQFVEALDRNQNRGYSDFMALMDKYRTLAQSSKVVKLETEAKIVETRSYVREHLRLPDGA